jgi:hypothetical protein
MSPRHFVRAFQSETGITSAKAVEGLLVEAARAAPKSGAASVKQVAVACGSSDRECMRRSFERLLTPNQSLSSLFARKTRGPRRGQCLEQAAKRAMASGGRRFETTGHASSQLLRRAPHP